MNLTLKRNLKRDDGIFGTLLTPSGQVVAVTLEHAYPDGNGSFIAKIPKGQYACDLGKHFLAGMTSFFETFEVTNVPGHSNILFHWGNFDNDSSGCVLLGETIQAGPNGEYMIMHSKDSFEKFMELQNGIKSFALEVS